MFSFFFSCGKEAKVRNIFYFSSLKRSDVGVRSLVCLSLFLGLKNTILQIQAAFNRRNKDVDTATVPAGTGSGVMNVKET